MSVLNLEDLTWAWVGVLAYYDTETRDGRIIRLPEGGQRVDLPIPVRIPVQAPYGSVPLEIVGIVTDLRIEGNRLIASGRCTHEMLGIATSQFDRDQRLIGVVITHSSAWEGHEPITGEVDR